MSHRPAIFLLTISGFIYFPAASQAIQIASFPQSINAGLDQLHEQEVFAVRLAGVVPYPERYEHKEFKAGLLFFSTRKKTDTLKLNYDIYFRSMSIIDKKGDTLLVPDFELIKYVIMEGTLYYHRFQKGFYRIVTNPNDSVSLAVQRGLKVIYSTIIGDREIAQTVSTNQYFSLVYTPENPKYYRQNIILFREISYFLFDRHGAICPATRSNFLKLFPKYSRGIDGYLKQLARQKTPIKFNREEDLKVLLKFCLSLG